MKSILSNKKKSFIKPEILKSGISGMPMALRLFLFLFILVLTILLGTIAILLITGTFTAGLSESEKIVENELLHASQEISQEYGSLSIQAIEFSKALSKSIEEELNKLDITTANLQGHPELLEEIISNEYEQVLLTLQISKGSGAFFILDATINPNLDNAQNSRAGLYIKNMEPNIISASTPNFIVLRGFPSIGRKNSLPLHAQWQMEFDISSAQYYHRPVVAANLNPNLQLSRLYYWSTAITLPNTSEEVMLCSVPLIDSDGNVFGVCGLEISSMLFKLSHSPKRTIYNRLFSVLSPVTDESISLQQSMFSGGYSTRIISKGNTPLKISNKNRYFYSYSHNQDILFLGIHTPIELYPEDSAFSDESWAVAVMVPEEDVVSSVTRLNLILFSSLILLVIVGIILSVVLSRKFVKPISEGFDAIKSLNTNEAPKTNVPEIDDLIDFLTTQNEEMNKNNNKEGFSLSILDEFLENTKELSPSERSVFDLYVKGYNAKEIAEELCLSINTIKTHNKHIYMKLNIASRGELLVYVNMLKEIGKEFK